MGEIMKISQEIFNNMPKDLQDLFVKLPNPEKDEVLELFLEQTKGKRAQYSAKGGKGYSWFEAKGDGDYHDYDDSGSAARFFYQAKVSKGERNKGLPKGMRNTHPTVKPINLLKYLVRLTKTPTGGIVLDPFMGSGSTGCASVLEGRDFIGIELEQEYFEIAKHRIEYYENEQK